MDGSLSYRKVESFRPVLACSHLGVVSSRLLFLDQVTEIFYD